MAGGGCKHGCAVVCGALVSALFEYDTAKIVHIKNKKVGLMNRVIQLGIVGYIIVWGIILQKGYQKAGTVQGAVTTKLKGAWKYNLTRDGDFSENCSEIESREWLVYDPADYVIPPQEPNSFFVMTNIWMTCNQTYGNCTESPDVHDAKCTDDSQCHPVGRVFNGGNGPTTGQCNPDDGRCEIYAWCPTQNENKNITYSGPKINASNFTVLIKNSIQFPTLLPGERKRNILGSANSTFLTTCRFDPNTTDGLYCPILSLQQIVDMVDTREDYFRNLSLQGGVIGLEINWSCDLDWGLDSCDPKYSARRLDNPDTPISPGYNFRFAKNYYREGVEYRSLIKAYGILFKIQITGQGGKFEFFTLVLKLGSMIALLGIAVVVSDVIVLYLLKKRSFYREKKYLNVVDTEIEKEDYEVITEPEEYGEKRPINRHTPTQQSYD